MRGKSSNVFKLPRAHSFLNLLLFHVTIAWWKSMSFYEDEDMPQHENIDHHPLKIASQQ